MDSTAGKPEARRTRPKYLNIVEAIGILDSQVEMLESLAASICGTPEIETKKVVNDSITLAELIIEGPNAIRNLSDRLSTARSMIAEAII